jgi:transposase
MRFFLFKLANSKGEPLMSTSLLYHAFGVHGYKYVNTKYKEGAVIFTIEQDQMDLRCAHCHSRLVIRRGQKWRKFRTVPIGSRTVWIRLGIQRVHCMLCCLIRQVKISFADPRRSYTRAFERYALELSRHMTIKDVARHLGVSWDVVKEIQKRHLKKKYAHINLKNVFQIAIDEISIGKGHRYLTVVLDLFSGAVLFVGDGKGADALTPFFRRTKRCRTQIQAVAIDMSPAYIQAVKAHLPQAKIVFDHFHVIKLYNDKLADLRRQLYREMSDDLQRKVLKGTRWLLLKNPENLNDDNDEKERLQAALKINSPLAAAYYLKEDLRQIWDQRHKTDARRVLHDWIKRAKASGVRMLARFAKTLAAHANGILNYYDFPISTGPLEGTNNKIKTMQRQAYGFRDMDFFKLKIYDLHSTKYALVG